MNIEKNIKKDIIERAERLLYYNNLLIKQSDSWLSEEEGVKNMERRISERKKTGTGK